MGNSGLFSLGFGFKNFIISTLLSALFTQIQNSKCETLISVVLVFIIICVKSVIHHFNFQSKFKNWSFGLNTGLGSTMFFFFFFANEPSGKITRNWKKEVLTKLSSLSPWGVQLLIGKVVI